MSNRQLTILGVVAAVMLVCAIFQAHRTGTTKVTSTGSTYLLQGLPTEEITRIEFGITKAKEEANKEDSEDEAARFTILKTAKGYVIPEKDNYPADAAKVRKLLLDCLAIQVGEKITSESENHKELGVDITDANAFEGTVIKFYRQDDENKRKPRLVTGIVVGKSNAERGGNYIRRVDSNDVYLAARGLYLDKQVTNYIERKLFDSKRERTEKENIEKVVLTRSDGADRETYTLELDPNDKVVLKEAPPSRTIKKYDCEQVFEALSSLSFDDVQLESEKTKAYKYDVIYRCFLKDSTVYMIGLAREGDKRYIKCRASFTDPKKVQKKPDESADEHLKRVNEIVEAIEIFNYKHGNWVYELASWEAAYLDKKLEEILEEEKKEEETKDEAKVDKEPSTTDSVEEKSQIKDQDVNAPPD